jgi:hypothetical protein
MIHVFWSERMGYPLAPERQAEVGIRRVADRLGRIRVADPRPLTIPRPAGARSVGNCRDFAVMTGAILRNRGVPARARCGFGTYFEQGRFIDHWICERFSHMADRWIRFYPQIDVFQREALHIYFDPNDLPPEAFLSGAEAWRLARSGGADPARFGIFEMYGLWFIRGNLVRDLAALNKVELLPWDGWRMITRKDEDLAPDDWALCDSVAELLAEPDLPLARIHAIYRHEPRLEVGREISSCGPAGR